MTLVFVPPEVGRKAARGDEVALCIVLEDDVAAEVAQGRFQHVENELGPRGAARGAAAEFGAEVLLVLGIGEILEHLGGRAEEDHAPAFVEQQRFREHLEKLRGRLVDGDEDDLVVRHRADDLDDVLAVLRAEAACRFVEKENVRAGDHVQADVQPLALAAGERLFHRRIRFSFGYKTNHILPRR